MCEHQHTRTQASVTLWCCIEMCPLTPPSIHPSNAPPGWNILTFGSDSVCKPSCSGWFLSLSLPPHYLYQVLSVYEWRQQWPQRDKAGMNKYRHIQMWTWVCTNEHKCRRQCMMVCVGTRGQQWHEQTNKGEGGHGRMRQVLPCSATPNPGYQNYHRFHKIPYIYPTDIVPVPF